MAHREQLRGRLACCMLLAGLPSACGTTAGPPIVLSAYRDHATPGNRDRGGPHPAIDFGGTYGDPILAAADGSVTKIYHDGGGPCGNGFRLWHEDFGRYTLYCQLADMHVKLYDRVKRGQVVGTLGFSGEPSWFAKKIPMLHFEVADDMRVRGDGDLAGTHDPMQFIVGCFDPAKSYPTNRFVLTYPVACRDGR